MAGGDIHEIRVHGVNDSPPAEMLETTPDGIEVRAGAGAGVFWQRKRRVQADIGFDVEAYSWGAQTRLGGGALAVVGTALVHVGWFLLLPYALVNLAYWTRAGIPPQSSERKAWDGGPGAGAVRLFGLVLTLIATAAFATVAVDLVAVQCYRTPDGSPRVCAALPGAFDVAASWSEDARAAVFGTLPVVVLVVLYAIVRRGRVGFEPALESFGRTMAGRDEPGVPLLSVPGFWTAARIRNTSEWLHLAAATFLVVLLLAVRPGDADPWRVVFAGAAAVGIVVCGVVVVLASSTPDAAGRTTSSPVRRTARKQDLAFLSLLAAGVLYAGWAATSGLRAPAPDATTAFEVAPTVLVAAALLLALWAVCWDRPSRGRRAAGLALVVAAGACFLATLVRPGGVPAVVFTLAGLLLLGIHVALALAPATRAERDRTAFLGWGGRGAAVGMLLALLVSIALSSLLVLAVSAWLGAVPAQAAGFQRVVAPALPAEVWAVPDAYEKSAIVLALVVASLAVLLAAVAVALLRRRALPRLTVPALAWEDPRAAAAERERLENAASGTAEPGPGYPSPLPGDDPSDPTVGLLQLHAEARAKRRRLSHLVHRGERLAAWIAGITAIALVVLVSPGTVEAIRRAMEHLVPGSPTAVRIAAVSLLAATALAAAAKVVADAVSHRERPLGTFWDVVGFFPRAAHPFAPPCFGERCVPELAGRVRGLLHERPDARVILSAHSMGSTISVATILALRGETDAEGRTLTDDVALLSFGSQLRGFFSRFFPSVFGAGDLGVPGLRGPSLWRADPWALQVRAEFDGPPPAVAAGAETSLRGILTREGGAPRWRNLWRRTDFLGFPVHGYPSAGNPIDRGAGETPDGYVWTIATHSPYLGLEQYALARAELARELRGGPRR